MPLAPSPFVRLLDQARQELRYLREGQRPVCPALAELVKTFQPLLLHTIRRRLTRLPLLQRLYEATDFAQEVWLHFFARVLLRASFAAPEELARYLSRMGRSRVRAVEWRYLKTRKRNLAREALLDALCEAGVEVGMSHEPGPERVVRASEEWEQVLGGQPASVGPVLSLLGEGCPAREVAEKLGVSERTVKRVQTRARSARNASGSEAE